MLYSSFCGIHSLGIRKNPSPLSNGFAASFGPARVLRGELLR